MAEKSKAGEQKIAEPKAGDLVRLTLKEKDALQSISGTLMQSPMGAENFAIIKLESGYNKGVEKKSIVQVSVLEKLQTHEIDTLKTHEFSGQKHSKKNLELPTISILHTGGTIASKVDYATGGVTNKFTPEDIILMFPELNNIANLHSRLIRNMASDDMRFGHYNIMAHEIEKELELGTDGIIITQGTDTLHYTSAALSFILRDLPIPVIIVGAQRSSDRGSSDAALNMINAARFIAGTDFAGVAVCMHDTTDDNECSILPCLKCRKMHTSRRDAFRAINASPIARVSSYNTKFLSDNYAKRDKKRKLKLMPMNPGLRIGLLNAHPNMHAEEFLAYAGFDGLIIEATGLGHIPMNEIDEETKEHTKIFEAVKSLIGDGTIVALAPQTIYGRINLNVYAPARKLKGIGVLGDLCDMHPETAFIKLAWLLSNFSKEEAGLLYEINIAGEISESTGKEEYLN